MILADPVMFDFLSSALVTILVTIDPPGLVPVFLTLTRGMSPRESLEVAIRASLIAFGILAFFAFGGGGVLEQLGISLAAFRIAGGILLFYIAFGMVFEKQTERTTTSAKVVKASDEHIRNISTFPLAIPLMAGPGTITAVILLSGRASRISPETGAFFGFMLLIGVITVGVIACFCAFLAAKPISRVLGITGNIILSRLLGVILAGLAVQFMVDGLSEVFNLQSNV